MSKIEVCVIGLGFVGAASCTAISRAKDNSGNLIFNVTGIEKNTPGGIEIVKKINKGNFPFEINDAELLKSLRLSIAQKNLKGITDKNVNYKKYDIICVDINLDIEKINSKNYHVNFDNIKKLFKKIASQIKPETLILLESTVPPGTCEKILWPIIVKEAVKKRKIPENNLLFAHSFERVMPGENYLKSIQNYWRVYSGINKQSKIKCSEFLSNFINTDEFPLTELNNIRDSETAKIIENSYRAVNISFIEEWSQFCSPNNIDLISILDSIRLRPTHNNIMRPGLGVGGYCLTKDPLMGEVSQKQVFKSKKSNFNFCKKAIKINRKMPISTLNDCKSLLIDKKKTNCLILGFTYKENIADIRHSASEILANELKKIYLQVLIYDPMLKKINLKKYHLIQNIEKIEVPIDSIFLAVKHEEFSTKKFLYYLEKSKANIFDFNCVLSKEKILHLRSKGSTVFSKGMSL